MRHSQSRSRCYVVFFGTRTRSCCSVSECVYAISMLQASGKMSRANNTRMLGICVHNKTTTQKRTHTHGRHAKMRFTCGVGVVVAVWVLGWLLLIIDPCASTTCGAHRHASTIAVALVVCLCVCNISQLRMLRTAITRKETTTKHTHTHTAVLLIRKASPHCTQTHVFIGYFPFDSTAQSHNMYQ